MIVVPSEVCYLPKFTYIWTLGVGRFPDALVRRVKREHALREIARCFLTGAGVTVPGEMARVTGLPRPEAGLGNRALVAEGFASMLAPGVYRLVDGRWTGRQAQPTEPALAQTETQRPGDHTGVSAFDSGSVLPGELHVVCDRQAPRVSVSPCLKLVPLPPSPLGHLRPTVRSRNIPIPAT